MIDYIYNSVDRVDPTVKKNLVGMEEEPFLVTLEIDNRGRTVFSLAFTCTHAVTLAARALRHIVFMLIFVDLLWPSLLETHDKVCRGDAPSGRDYIHGMCQKL